MISACIIAYNAENTIIDCLNSIKDYCSEIVIALDTKTTDETRQRVYDWARDNNPEDIHRGLENDGRQIGIVKLYDYEWLNDSFSEARNFTLSKATGEWILIIDCDERLANAITPDDSVDCYLVTARNYKDNIIVSDYWTPRLFKNNIGIEFRADTDEENWHCLKGTGKVVRLSNMILNHKEKSEKDALKKAKWLLKRNMKSLPNEAWNPYLRGQISHRHLMLGSLLKCIYYGAEAMVGAAEPEVKALQCVHLYRAFRMMRDASTDKQEAAEYWDHAIFWLKASVSACPQQLSANALLYDFYKEENNVEAMQYHKDLLIKTGNNSLLPYDVKFENLNIN